MPITKVKVAGIDCDDLLRPNSTSVVVTGTDFGFIQAWPLRLCDGPTLGAAKVDQVVTAWSDTSITFNVNLGSLAESDTLYLRIDDGGSTPMQRRVTVSQPDVSVHAGSFTASLTTGSQVMVTGLPSRPKAVIWWTSGASGLSQVSGQGVCFSCNFLYLNHAGLSVSHSAGASRNDAASYATKGRRTTGVSLTSILTNNTTRTSTFAFTADGFSINWLQADTVARVIHYIAFCGRTVSASGVASTAVSAGSFASLPHKPDVVFVGHDANTGGNATDGPMLGFGAIAKDAVGTLKQWSCAWSAFSPDGSSSFVHSKLATDRFAEQVYNGAATWSAQATALAYQTCTWSGTDTDVLQHLSLFLDGTTVDLGTVTKAASATSTNIGAISDPDAVLLVTGGGTKDVVEGYANMAVGVATASHQSHARTWADLIGSLTEGTQASDTAKAIGSYSSSGAAQDVGTLSLAGTPAITWDAPRAGTSEVAYLAFKVSRGLSGGFSSRALFGAKSQACASFAGVVTSMAQIGGVVAASSNLVGECQCSAQVDGNLQAVASLFGAVLTRNVLGSAVAAQAVLLGEVQLRTATQGIASCMAPLNGSSAANSRVSGTVQAWAALGGTLTCATRFSGALALESSSLVGVIRCSTSFSSSLRATAAMTATAILHADISLASLTATAAMQGNVLFAGVSAGYVSCTAPLGAEARLTSSLGSALSAQAALGGALICTARITGTLTIGGAGLVGVARCAVRMHGALQASASLGGTTVTQSQAAGPLSAVAVCTGEAYSRSSCTATATGHAALLGTWRAKSKLHGDATAGQTAGGAVFLRTELQSLLQAHISLVGTAYAASKFLGSLRTAIGEYVAHPSRTLRIEPENTTLVLPVESRVLVI